MHELGLCEGILEAVEKRAAGRRVERVRLRVGALHRVVEPALDQAFEMVAGGTVAEGAAVEMIVLPVRVACASCAHVTEGNDLPPVCDSCGKTNLEIIGGDELVLESIQLAPA